MMESQDPPSSASPSTSNPGFNIRMSSDEMLSRVLDWNLGCDTAVLNRLKDYSENMLKRAETIKENCNSCANEVDMLQTRVQSVTNQFLNLANEQFVENCVEEFEERDMIGNQASSSPLVHQVKTKAEKEAELIKKMKESIRIGIQSNSLCDQEKSSVPKVKTAHIIGTSKFFSSRFCGLLEDDRLPVAKKTAIPSETPSDQEYLAQPPPAVLDSISIPKVKATSSTDSDYLFQTRENAQSQLSKHTSSLSSEDNFLSGANRTPVTSSSNSVETNNSHEPDLRKPEYPAARQPISIIDDLNRVLQARAPPPVSAQSDSEEDFKPRTGNARDLFADDDEDLFGVNANTAQENQRIESGLYKPVLAKPVTNQINSIADLIKSQNKPPLEQKKHQQSEPVKKSVFLESDSDDDLFSPSNITHLPKPTKQESLFANHVEQEPSASARVDVTPAPQLKPSGLQDPVINTTVSSRKEALFADKDIPPVVSKSQQKTQRSIFDESDSDEDLFSTSSSRRGTSAPSTDTEQPSKPRNILPTTTKPQESEPPNLFKATPTPIIKQSVPKIPEDTSFKHVDLNEMKPHEEKKKEVENNIVDGKHESPSPPNSPKELVKPVQEAEGAVSRKAVSRKLESIFKATGPPLPGFPPKRKTPNVQAEQEVSVNTSENNTADTISSGLTSPQAQITSEIKSRMGIGAPVFEHEEESLKQHSLHRSAPGNEEGPTTDTPTSPLQSNAIAQPANVSVREGSTKNEQRSIFLLSDDEDDGLRSSVLVPSSSKENKIDCEAPITFDQPPPTSNLLSNMAKNRAKISHARRKPTRKPAGQSGESKKEWAEVSTESINDEVQKAGADNREEFVPPTEENERKNSRTQATDIRPTNDSPNPATASDPQSSKEGTLPSSARHPSVSSEPNTTPKVTEPAASIVKSDGSKTIPSATVVEPPKAKPSSTLQNKTAKEDLSIRKSVPPKQSVFDDSDEDIFVSAKSSRLPTPSSSNVLNGETSAFPVAASSTAPQKPDSGVKTQPQSKTNRKTIFADSDSDSDDALFASNGKGFSQQTVSAPQSAQIFANDHGKADNDNRDLFGNTTSSPAATKITLPSKAPENPPAATKSSTIEASKYPPAAAKSSTTKTSKSNLKQKSIFDDSDSDSDDLFKSKSVKSTLK